MRCFPGNTSLASNAGFQGNSRLPKMDTFPLDQSCNLQYTFCFRPAIQEAGALFSFTLAGSSTDTKKPTELCFFQGREGSGLLIMIKIRCKSSLNGCNVIEETTKKNISSPCLNHHTSTHLMSLSPLPVPLQCTISNYPKPFCTVTASQMRFLSCLWAGKLRHELVE